MNLLPRRIWAGALSALLLAAYGCGGGGAVDPADRIALDSIAVTPSPVTVEVGATQTLNVVAFAQGQALSGATISYATQNATVAAIDASGLVRGVAAGSATVEVTATFDGVTRSTTVTVTVTAAGSGTPPPGSPSGGNTTATVTTSDREFVPTVVTIAPGGSVTWQIANTTHNVTFGTNKPTGGDIPNTSPGGSATRVFPNAGTYPYQCTLHSNMTGTVMVQTGSTGGGGGGGGGVPQNPDAVVSVTSDAFTPEYVEIAPGGTVVWVFSATNNVTFEDDSPPGGNIPDTQAGTSVARTFPAEGDYDYVSTRNRNMKGRIRVR